MTIGGGIALAAIGAILLFAVEFRIAGLDLSVVGVILLLAGLTVVLIGLAGMSRRRRVVTTPVTEVQRERLVERDPEVF
jgi:hypothetical protein